MSHSSARIFDYSLNATGPTFSTNDAYDKSQFSPRIATKDAKIVVNFVAAEGSAYFTYIKQLLVQLMPYNYGLATGSDPGFAKGQIVPKPYVAKQVAPGGKTTCAILEDDSIKCWGTNKHGKLGQGTSSNIGTTVGSMDSLQRIDLGDIPPSGTLLSHEHCAISGTAGTDYQCYELQAGKIGTDVSAITESHVAACALSIEAGGFDKFHIDATGLTNQCCGCSASFGENTTEYSFFDLIATAPKTAKQVSSSITHTWAILVDDSLKCWGKNSEWQLGQGHVDSIGDAAGEMGDALVAVDLGKDRTAKQVRTGEEITIPVS